MNTIIVFIYDKKILKKEMKNIVKLVFEILEKYYNYKKTYSYNINVYTNKYYGLVIELNQNDLSINLNILRNVLFLYEVDDPLNYLDEEIYFYENKYYINLKKIDETINENANVIYGKEAYKILGNGIKI